METKAGEVFCMHAGVLYALTTDITSAKGMHLYVCQLSYIVKISSEIINIETTLNNTKSNPSYRVLENLIYLKNRASRILLFFLAKKAGGSVFAVSKLRIHSRELSYCFAFN